MTRVVIQPAGGDDAQAHYVDTVVNPVSVEAHAGQLGQHLDPLRSAFPDGAAPMWGVTPGKNDVNARKWAKATPGDVVVFTGHNRLFASGTIAYMMRNAPLARQLWGEDADGQTWEWMYVLDEVSTIDIPYDEFAAAVGYEPTWVPLGFNVLDETKSEAALQVLLRPSGRHHPDVEREDYTEAVKQFDELDRLTTAYARVEQNYLRRRLFGGAPEGRCDLCGRTFPTELLVAAHIKRRAACSADEKNDVPAVVMAACVFGCDALYERGYLTVSAEGRVMPTQVPVAGSARAYLEGMRGRACTAHSTASAGYFAWHRSHVFRRPPKG